MKKIIVPLVLGGMALVSACSKSVIVSNGEQFRLIKVAGKIETHKDSMNNTITSFHSVKGSTFNINMTDYAITIK